jgi:hypothetical protein
MLIASFLVAVEMRSESEIQQLIQLAGPKHACILLRNNSGALTDKQGRLVRYGLGNISERHNELIKSSDLIGITVMTITPDMVGKSVGVFTAIEVKREDWQPTGDKRERAQNAFIEWVKAHGGLAGFANSVERFEQIIKR